MTDFVFLIDIILKFNSAIYNDDNIIIQSYQEIASHYLKTWMLLDIAASIPYELVPIEQDIIKEQYHSVNIILRLFRLRNLKMIGKVIRLLKLLKCLVNMRIIKFLFNYFSLSHKAARLATTLIAILISIHVMSCL